MYLKEVHRDSKTALTIKAINLQNLWALHSLPSSFEFPSFFHAFVSY